MYIYKDKDLLWHNFAVPIGPHPPKVPMVRIKRKAHNLNGKPHGLNSFWLRKRRVLPGILKIGVVHETGWFLFNLAGGKREEDSSKESRLHQGDQCTLPPGTVVVWMLLGTQLFPVHAGTGKYICVLMWVVFLFLGFCTHQLPSFKGSASRPLEWIIRKSHILLYNNKKA